MAPLPTSYLVSRAAKPVPCYSNCHPPNLSGLGALVVVAFLAVLLGVYFYKLNKAKRLYREKNIQYSKAKIFWQALLAASIVGLIVMFANGQGGSSNTAGTANNDAAAAVPAPAGEGVGPSMGPQLEEEGVAANLNNMTNQSTSLAAQDGVLG